MARWPRFPECARACEQGREVRAASEGWTPPRDTIPIMPPKQRAAAARWYAERLPFDLGGGIGPVREAALLSPDDRDPRFTRVP